MSFDPQKTDIDEQIDLVLTLVNMLQQDEHAKIEKFIETMLTIIQTHLIIEPNWAEVTKKAKNLEHIIQRCDPPAIAPPIVQGAGAVPNLYSHITQSQDQDSDTIPKPFKSTKGRGGKKSSKGKQKTQPSPLPPEVEEHYEEKNNYYHNENNKGNNRGHIPYWSQQGSGRRPYRGSQQRRMGQHNNYWGQYQSNSRQFNTFHGAYSNNNYYSNYQGRGRHSHGGNSYRGYDHGRGNYRGHNNYQYHQYYTHDDSLQVEQYGPPCALCSGFNHSPKHCFKGEHDINNLMEKMSLGSKYQHQSGLYQ